uniref:RNase_PH domain-containing protein n=1 Tax=Glossina brevipalpis TaxID=37001 RepID=A0A1A9WB24_9MUSC
MVIANINMQVVNEDVMKNIKLRTLSCELNPLTRTDGSVLFSQGATCVLASMLGPVEVKLQNLKIDKANVECIYRPKAGLPTIRDKIREVIIKDTCETALLATLHPRTLISVQLQELDDRGGLDACAINAACMALLIGGVPMKFTVAAVHCVIDKNGEIILDPDQFQAVDNRASFTFVFDSLERDLVTVHSFGCFKMSQFKDAHLMCLAASNILFDFYRKIMSNFHNKINTSEEDNYRTENIDTMET